jgi:hypothetical protein
VKNSICIILLAGLFFGCHNKKVKYSAFNDLFLGAQQVVLFDNGEFYLELGAGGAEGRYTLQKDTVFLNYYEKPR